MLPRRRNSVLEVLELLRRTAPGLSPSGMLMLLYIAENPGVSGVELAELCATTEANASRTVRALFPAGDPDALPSARGFVVARAGARSRMRSLWLSPEGLALCRCIDERIRRAVLINADVEATVIVGGSGDAS